VQVPGGLLVELETEPAAQDVQGVHDGELVALTEGISELSGQPRRQFFDAARDRSELLGRERPELLRS
jgi:hypothetical protein